MLEYYMSRSIQICPANAGFFGRPIRVEHVTANRMDSYSTGFIQHCSIQYGSSHPSCVVYIRSNKLDLGSGTIHKVPAATVPK